MPYHSENGVDQINKHHDMNELWVSVTVPVAWVYVDVNDHHVTDINDFTLSFDFDGYERDGLLNPFPFGWLYVRW